MDEIAGRIREGVAARHAVADRSCPDEQHGIALATASRIYGNWNRSDSRRRRDGPGHVRAGHVAAARPGHGATSRALRRRGSHLQLSVLAGPGRYAPGWPAHYRGLGRSRRAASLGAAGRAAASSGRRRPGTCATGVSGWAAIRC
ncbi:hypothetical protein ACU4GD_06100 [Cupriavidus basilensis]